MQGRLSRQVPHAPPKAHVTCTSRLDDAETGSGSRPNVNYQTAEMGQGPTR